MVVDETYVKVNGVWRYVYRAIDEDGQSSTCWFPDAAAARRFFCHAYAERWVHTVRFECLDWILIWNQQ